jgi:hypothetical protein
MVFAMSNHTAHDMRFSYRAQDLNFLGLWICISAPSQLILILFFRPHICLATASFVFGPGKFPTNVSRLPKLPHSRHDAARAKRVDGDGGFKAAIWGGALAARQTCVVCCVCAATAVFFSAAALAFVLFLFLAAPSWFFAAAWNCAGDSVDRINKKDVPDTRSDDKHKNKSTR